MNASFENVNEVIDNLTRIVKKANQAIDQNSDNLKVVAKLLTQSVDIIAIQNTSIATITLVS